MTRNLPKCIACEITRDYRVIAQKKTHKKRYLLNRVSIALQRLPFGYEFELSGNNWKIMRSFFVCLLCSSRFRVDFLFINTPKSMRHHVIMSVSIWSVYCQYRNVH